MSDPMRIRANLINSTVEVKLMIKHPMESGYRKGEDGKRIPAHFIETLVVRCKDKVILDAYLGLAISENPYIAFNFKGADGAYRMPNDFELLNYVKARPEYGKTSMAINEHGNQWTMKFQLKRENFQSIK